jgi:hypothetical protein
MLDKTYLIVGVTCLLIGSAGYILYGDMVKDEVTLNLPAGTAATVALALITVNPFSKFALTMDPVARGLEDSLGIDIAAKEVWFTDNFILPRLVPLLRSRSLVMVCCFGSTMNPVP